MLFFTNYLRYSAILMCKQRTKKNNKTHTKWTIPQTLPLVPTRHKICHSQFTCSRTSDIPYLTLPKSLNMYGERLQCLLEERLGGHKIQADALNDDINVTAICDVHTSLKSRSPPPHLCSFLVFRYFDFHEASCLARNEETVTKRAEREGFLSSHRLSDTVTATLIQ